MLQNVYGNIIVRNHVGLFLLLADNQKHCSSLLSSLLLSEGGSGSLLLLLLRDASLSLAGLGLLLEGLSLNGLSLSLVDGFNQDSLVLELVTLGSHVEEVIDMVIDLSLLAVLAKQSTKNSLSSDPQNLGGHTSLSGTSAFTRSHVTALSLGLEVQSNSGARVDGNGLLNDETILNQLSNRLSGVSKSNLAGLIRIQPDTALTALGHRSSKASLKLQRRLKG
jgi:hypothetical protein